MFVDGIRSLRSLGAGQAKNKPAEKLKGAHILFLCKELLYRITRSLKARDNFS